MIIRALWAVVTGVATASSVARNPISALATVEGAQILTQSHRITALSHFDLSFDLFDGHQHVRLGLEPNHDILHRDATVTYLGPDGEISHTEPIDRLQHKIYKGIASEQRADGSWANVGWARLNLRRDGVHPLFEGAFTVHHVTHHIQMSSSYLSTKHHLDPDIEMDQDEYMVVWRDSDIKPAIDDGTERDDLRKRDDDDTSCTSDDMDFNNNLDHPVYSEMLKRGDKYWGSMPVGSLFGKRQIDSQTGSGNTAGVNLVSTIGQTAGCPTTRKVALVGVATDCTYTGTFSSTNATRDNVITVMNSASQVWESAFNISLGLKDLTVSSANCPGSPSQTAPWNQDCDANLDIQARLNLFSAWRGGVRDNNSHWTLLTQCRTGSAVGLAWLGQACVQTAITSNTTGGGQETVSGANVVARTNTEWQVIAHETGHTFGAVHDCTDQTCAQQNVVSAQQCCPFSADTCPAGGNYIMNPSTSQMARTFSPCTVGNVCSAIGRNSVNTQCLSNNKGVATVSRQQCGNGIVEEGEDCDCGGSASCGNNSCCDPNTCRFVGNAVCDDSNEDCCRRCQFASSGTVCRASTGECDPAETCTGTGGNCPRDETAPEGQSCSLPAGSNVTNLDTSQLRCASGQCTSRDLQCKTVMGSYTHGSNDTHACDSSSCTLSCASPQFGVGVCYGLQQNLLDGTPCGGGGHCSNGHCSGSTVGGQVSSWVDDHRGLVIGIACAVGGLVLLAFLSCLIRCCRRPKRVKAVSPPPMVAGAMPAGGYYGGRSVPPPVPAHTSPAMPRQTSDWDGSGWRPPPLGQQQSYYQGAWNGPAVPVHMQQFGGGGGAQSARYA